MKSTLKSIASGLLCLALLDVLILLTAMSQLAVEGKTGAWSPFWTIQAKTLIHLIK